jgi:transposase
MAVVPWIVSDELWELFEPLLPKRERRFRYPGRTRLDDRLALQGILFVLHSGVAWQHLPAELGFGSGVTCWRRLGEWRRAGSGSGCMRSCWRITS